MTYSKTKSILSLCLAVALIASVGCGSSGETKSASPEDAFNNMVKAGDAKDWKKFCSCMTPDAVDVMAGGMAMMGMMMKDMPAMGSEESPAEKFAAVLKEHNINEDSVGKFDPSSMMNSDALRKVGAKVKDKPGLISSIMNVLAEMNNGPGKFDFSKAKITDIKIDGDTAVGQSTGMGSPAEQEIKFKKINGNWLVDYDLNG